MRIIGIDPGIGRAGWGILEKNGTKYSVLSSGCIETSKNTPMEMRLEALYGELSNILNEYKPDCMAIEDIFFNTNAKTALIVGQARGVVLLVGSMYKLEIGVYTPLQVKIAIAGYGRAEKNQVEKMMMKELGIFEKPKYDDTSDALAIALTHGISFKLKEKY